MRKVLATKVLTIFKKKYSPKQELAVDEMRKFMVY